MLYKDGGGRLFAPAKFYRNALAIALPVKRVYVKRVYVSSVYMLTFFFFYYNFASTSKFQKNGVFSWS